MSVIFTDGLAELRIRDAEVHKLQTERDHYSGWFRSHYLPGEMTKLARKVLDNFEERESKAQIGSRRSKSGRYIRK